MKKEKKSFISELYKKRFRSTSDESWFRNKMWEILCSSYFRKLIKKKSVVLDMPCGYCDFINNIEAKQKIAIDINPDSKKYANKNVVYFSASSTKIPLQSLSVDIVFVSNFFEHITRDRILLTIKEFWRILRKNGKVIVLQPNIRFCQNNYWRFFDHITPIDDRALDEVFGCVGFRTDKKIVKFLPYTAKGATSIALPLLWLYLRLPILWSFFGKQSLLIYEK